MIYIKIRSDFSQIKQNTKYMFFLFIFYQKQCTVTIIMITDLTG